jgi:hypothetical protein
VSEFEAFDEGVESDAGNAFWYAYALEIQACAEGELWNLAYRVWQVDGG